jgi:nucleosome binding factor SPN SPT16 subunit
MKNKYCYADLLIKAIDLLFIILVLSFLINDLISILISLIENLSKLNINKDIVNFMVAQAHSNNTTQLESHTTDVKIIHNEGGWGALARKQVLEVFLFTLLVL